MRTADRFWRELWVTLDEWDDGERDWPDVDAILAVAAGSDIDPDKAKALLAGLWTCDRLLDDPERQRRRRRALGEAAIWREGPYHDRELEAARVDAERQYERLKSLLIYGFWLDRGRSNVSQADIRLLLDALALVVEVNTTTRAERIGELFRQFRSRINKMRQRRGEAEEAANLFSQVYGAVLQNQADRE